MESSVKLIIAAASILACLAVLYSVATIVPIFAQMDNQTSMSGNATNATAGMTGNMTNSTDGKISGHGR